MTANQGKFVDRFPIIHPAGAVYPSDGASVAECLQRYTTDDHMDALMHDGGIWEMENHRPPFPQYKPPPLQNKQHCGIYTGARDALNPPVKTRFQALIEDLKETTYNTYWNKNVGKPRDFTAGLPAGADPLEMTFGIRTPKEVSLKETVYPPVSAHDVQWEGQVGHKLYRKSHNDYNPSEQIDRNYLRPAFDPNKRYGKHTAFDTKGTMARCCLDWYNKEPIVKVQKAQADLLQRTKPQVGKCLAPNNNIDCVEEGHVFGEPSIRNRYNVDALLKDPDCPPSFAKKEFHKWMCCLNQLRTKIKKMDVFKFDIRNFKKRVLNYDKEHTGLVPKDLVYRLMQCFYINWDTDLLEPLLYLLGILEGDQLRYLSFLNLIDVNQPLPDFPKLNDIPQQHIYLISTQKAMSCDYLFIDNSGMPTSGLPSKRFDLPQVSVPLGQCEADKGNLSEETSAGVLVNPSIYTNYGLSHWDFFRPRPPQEIRTLFEKIGDTFPDDTFDKLWQMGVERDKTGLVCVDTFKKLVAQMLPQEA